MTTETKLSRADRLKALLEEYQQNPTDYDEGEEEDPRPYLSGEEECEEWCCVTVNYTSHGNAKYFFLPTFGNRHGAEHRAIEFVEDDLFEELPVAVVNLDTGTSYKPTWESLTWSRN
jgi:hypothetical protein